MEVVFDFVKTWENDTFEDRPDEITVEIYGTTNARAAGELLRTQTIKVSDDLDKDGDPNTWEYTIEGIETTYRNFYMVERSEDERYEVTENFIAPANNEKVRPYVGNMWKHDIWLEKTWVDDDNALGLRPEEVTFNVYGSNQNDEATKDLVLTVVLTETDFHVTYVNPNYSIDNYSGENDYGWSAYIDSDNMPEYMWLEEVDLIDNYSMTYILNSSMENWFVITNTLVNAEPPRLMMRFNAALTNTFVE